MMMFVDMGDLSDHERLRNPVRKMGWEGCHISGCVLMPFFIAQTPDIDEKQGLCDRTYLGPHCRLGSNRFQGLLGEGSCAEQLC